MPTTTWRNTISPAANCALANQQLELALAAPNLTSVQRERFRAQLEEVRGWLREQQDSRRRSVGGS